MEHKTWDANAYRRAYYQANPDKRLKLEERTACSLLRRLGYKVEQPADADRANAFNKIIEERKMKRRKEGEGACYQP